MNANTNIGWAYYRDYFNGQVFTKAILESADTEKHFKTKNLALINESYHTSSIKKYFEYIKESFSLETIYPGLLIGSGYAHEVSAKGELKLGLFFDHTTGLPVIPGSSVKGVLRSAFPQWDKKNDSKTPEEIKKVKTRWIKSLIENKTIEEVEYDDIIHEEINLLELTIFEGVKDNAKTKPEEKYYSIYQRDIFFDAYIESKSDIKILGTDAITPHVKEGLSHEEAMLKNPIPIPFLKILPGVIIKFNFKLVDNVKKAEEKLHLFKQILLTTGIGAKTNVGYGQFK